MSATFIINLVYLIGVLSFVLGLRLLGSPDTARRGNLYAAAGMGIAIIGTLLYPIEGADNNYLWILTGLLLGGAIGWATALKVKMTAMPQLVSIFNGLGGACAALLAITEFIPFYKGVINFNVGEIAIGIFALLVGAISLSGSLLAFGKLDSSAFSKIQ